MVDLIQQLPENLKKFYAEHGNHGRFGWGTDGRGLVGDQYYFTCANCAVGPYPITSPRTRLEREVIFDLTKKFQEAW